MAKKITVKLDTSEGIMTDVVNSEDIGEEIFTYNTEKSVSIGTSQASGNKYRKLREYPLDRIIKIVFE
ncbi:hypothetical protein [Sulfurimonas sp.]|jgi:hypothetical protein|uniref:hypothetical protein n=1 Tax=Sulfurimonas sp. TaxID=2022749 RepID=UPI0025FB3A07|nr:hypothetical protein [Sulfurimonas sp.]MCK9473353.1 hypothetical protein [Sulfurimonas sp.]